MGGLMEGGGLGVRLLGGIPEGRPAGRVFGARAMSDGAPAKAEAGGKADGGEWWSNGGDPEVAEVERMWHERRFVEARGKMAALMPPHPLAKARIRRRMNARKRGEKPAPHHLKEKDEHAAEYHARISDATAVLHAARFLKALPPHLAGSPDHTDRLLAEAPRNSALNKFAVEARAPSFASAMALFQRTRNTGLVATNEWEHLTRVAELATWLHVRRQVDKEFYEKNVHGKVDADVFKALMPSHYGPEELKAVS